MIELTDSQKEAVNRYFTNYSAEKNAGAGDGGKKGHRSYLLSRPRLAPEPEVVKTPDVVDKAMDAVDKTPVNSVNQQNLIKESVEAISEEELKTDNNVAAVCRPVEAAIIVDEVANPKDAIVKTGTKPNTVITCDGEVQFDYEKNKAYFFKNVRVVSEDWTIDSDKIMINFDPNTRSLTGIVADGNVKIARGDNTTYSERACYSEADKKMTLSGKPRFIFS
jgi:OstA-like protein.